MPDGTLTLSITALTLGFFHTLVGPDHYLPFIAMARVGRWSLNKTVVVTVLCGLGHVLSSIVLGFVGIALGIAALKLEDIEAVRGDIAGWLLIAFGLVYCAWGVRRAIRNRPHTHPHAHADGTLHAHEHVHQANHLHAHADQRKACAARGDHASAANPTLLSGETFASNEENCGTGVSPVGPRARRPCHTLVAAGCRAVKESQQGKMTPWILFAIFLFGPCEPLIPLLMYPAAKGDLSAVAWVAAIFGVATVVTMTTIVVVAHVGAGALPFARFQRYSHALAGFVILACGIAVKAGL